MKTFYQLLINTLIAGVTNITVWFALVFFVYLQTKAVFATAIISGIFMIANALTGFWFGSIVDHHKKKSVMLVSSIFSLFAFVCSYAIYYLYGADTFKNATSPILWLYVLMVMIGVVAGNLRGIALPTIVSILFDDEKRDKANGMVGTSTGVSFLIASVFSGILVGHSGMKWVLILAIIITILAIAHLSYLKVPERQNSAGEEEKPKNIDIQGTIKIISSVPGLIALILFACFNNLLGGVFMSLMDAYGLSLVSVEVWGILWGFLSTGFIIGGLIISKIGLGKNPLRALFIANLIIWTSSSLFTIQPSIILLTIGSFIYLCVVPYIEASEQTILQKVVPIERQGRVFGFAHSVEQAASPLTSFLIGPIAQYIFIPFMTTGAGVKLIGSWFAVGPDRGLALVFTLAGLTGLLMTILAMRSKFYRQLSEYYLLVNK